tara:strand:+ start:712 stop:1659 length:948 start_codon:yes stop_codon:yes gene_type:complete
MDKSIILFLSIFLFSSIEGEDMKKNKLKVVGIGGIFFKSENPDEIKKWYEENLGFQTDQWGIMFQSRDIENPDQINYLQWSPFHKDTDYFDPSKKGFMINYRVVNIEELVKALKEKNITVLLEVTEYGEIGKFAHILDPEGNKIELWEPPNSTEFDKNDKINSLSEHLKLFEPYIGKTFKGEFANSTKEKPVIDVSHWERILNGTAIRIIHSVNEGEYGGQTIITWNAEKNSLVSSYFTTAGFTTNAIIHFEGNKLISIEDVTGNENGITKVKGVMELFSNGELHISSQYFMNDTWVDGHEIHYKEDSKAKVIFK